MLKKSISLILALLIALFAVIPASAANEDDTLNNAQALAAVEVGISALVAEEEDSVDVSEDLADKIIENADTPEEIARAIAQFVFIEKEKVEEISNALVDDCKYTVVVTADGKDTVYVAVDLIAHPEIYDARVFLSVCDKLTTKCDEYAIANGLDTDSENYNPMSYYHIAGELAMHMIITDITTVMGADSWNTLLKKFYDMSSVADLNVDEARISKDIIELFGRFITFIFNTLFG